MIAILYMATVPRDGAALRGGGEMHHQVGHVHGVWTFALFYERNGGAFLRRLCPRQRGGGGCWIRMFVCSRFYADVRVHG